MINTFARRFFLSALAIAVVFSCTAIAQGAPAKPANPNLEAENKELDELFKAVPEDKLPAAITPSHQFKVQLVQVPNIGNWNNFSSRDLTGEDRVFSIGLLQGLEHRVYHSPHLYFDLGPESRRGKRVDARLRFADVPPRDADAEKGKLYGGFELACKVCNADILLATHWQAATKDGKPARGSLWRYRRGKGVEYGKHFEVPAMGTIELDAVAAFIHKVCEEACTGILPADEEAKFPAVPRMAATDKAIRLLADIQDALGKGDANGIWDAHATLQKEDPNCTRAARDAMMAFRSMGTHESNVRTIRTGLDAIAKDPTDAALRAYLAHEAWIIMGQRHPRATPWAKEVGAQALRIWPASVHAIIWYSEIACGMFSDDQITYLSSEGLKRCDDGRIQTALGTSCFNRRRFEEGVRWYQKARKLMPDEHDTAFSLGMCCTHGAEDLMDRALPGELGDKQRALADEFYSIGSEALRDAIAVDPSEMGWVYDFFVRCTTHKYHVLPTDPATLRTLFMVQACRNRLVDSNRGDDVTLFNRLCEDVLPAQRLLTRMAVHEAKPTDADYELQLMARLQLGALDGDRDDVVWCTRELRHIGNRGELFLGAMKSLAADVAAADKKEREEAERKKSGAVEEKPPEKTPEPPK